MTWRVGQVLALVVVSVVLAATAVGGFLLGQRASSASGSPVALPVEPIVLAISIDGLNPDALDAVGEAGAPNLHRLIREGASTLNARTADELTTTLPNHTGMLTGLRVAGHGVTFNDDNGATLEATQGIYVPGMFDVAHDHGLRTAFLAEKEKFRFLMRSWDGKTDIDQIGSASSIVARTQSLLLDGETDLIFLHLAAPDTAGHASGWLGPAYLSAVRDVDASLGRILSVIDGSPALGARVTILLTSDHGGTAGHRRHDDETLLANFRVAFIIWGATVAAGADLYALNPERADPGDGRAGYEGRQPVRNMDLANTALGILGLEAIEEGSMRLRWSDDHDRGRRPDR